MATQAQTADDIEAIGRTGCATAWAAWLCAGLEQRGYGSDEEWPADTRDTLAPLLNGINTEVAQYRAALTASMLILDRLQQGAGVRDEEIDAALAQALAVLDAGPAA